MSAYKVDLVRRAKIILENRAHKKQPKLRTFESPCLLCQHNLATQKDSHIAPKFLSKEILEAVGEMHLIASAAGEKKPQIVQDTPKEDYLFCPSCEQYFGFIEDYVKGEFFDKLWAAKDQEFKIISDKNYVKIVKCKTLSPKIFNLFVHSIIWRILITRHPFFRFLKVNHKVIEGLRRSLLAYKSTGKGDLLKNAKNINTSLFRSKYAILTCEKTPNPSSGFLSPLPCENPYYLVINRFHLIISFVENSSQLFLNYCNNNTQSNDEIVIGLMTEDGWEKLNSTFMNVFNENNYNNLKRRGKQPFDLSVYIDERNKIRANRKRGNKKGVG